MKSVIIVQSQLPLFLLQNPRAGYCGNSPLWWSSRGGYTDRIDDAKRFTESDADAECRASRSSHGFVKWPVADVLKVAYRVVDMQSLREVVLPAAADVSEKEPKS